MRTVALVPLRGGSKGIPLKNIKILNKKPLCAWTLEAACLTGAIDEVYVSTECQKIENVVLGLGLGIKVLKRPKALATDEASTDSVIVDFLKKVNFDILVTIQATSPFLKSKDLVNALNHFELQNLDSLISTNVLKQFLWNKNGTPYNYDPLNRPRRQDFDGEIVENGSFYISKRKIIEQLNCRIGGKVGFYNMPNYASLEIDEPLDLLIAEAYFAKHKL